LILILFHVNTFSQTSSPTETEHPFKLQLFCKGMVLGYESGFKAYASKPFAGYNVTFASKEERYAFLIDNYFAFNTAIGKWNFNNTLTYRTSYALGISYSSDVSIQQNRLHYAAGFGISYELGNYLSIGGFYYPRMDSETRFVLPQPPRREGAHDFGIRLSIRPIHFLMMQTNVGSHWKK
jgi:hypothetical protein